MLLSNKWLKQSKARATRSLSELQTTSHLAKPARARLVVKKRKVSSQWRSSSKAPRLIPYETFKKLNGLVWYRDAGET